MVDPVLSLETVSYGGWETCHRLSNNIIDLVITGDVGPRVIRLGFVNEENLFCEVADDLGKTLGQQWRMFGGHRFWHAPEDQERTYQPDNTPIEVNECDGVIHVVQSPESATGLQKEIDIAMSVDSTHVRITHRLVNHGMWDVTLAPWALSVMKTGGAGVVPLPPRGQHPENLLPANTLTMWPYTDMADSRWTWGTRYILLRQDQLAESPQKFGAQVPDGWVAYVVDGNAFVKIFEHDDGGTYPDLGCAIELFTNDFMLELETLAPLCTLEAGGTVEHTEDWFVFSGVELPKGDKDVEKNLLPLVKKAKLAVGRL